MRGPRLNEPMIERKSWEEFRAAGLLWWVNSLLHLFGWSIVVERGDDGQTIRDAYPAHCKFRGFDSKNNDKGFKRLTMHIQESTERMLRDVALEEDSEGEV